MARRDYSGNAKPGVLTGDINATSLSIPFNDATGWPSGGASGKFFVTINRGQSNEERVLVESRTGTTLTIADVGDRGVDDTLAADHTGGETIEHTFSGVDADEANAHVWDDTRDDHSQYLNIARHDVAGRHTFGGAYGTPTNPAAIGTVADDGSGDNPAKEDHVHILGTGSIFLANQFAPGVIDAAALGASAVTNAKLANDAVSTAKILNDAVTTIKILDQAVTAAKIALATITGAQLADGAVTAGKIGVGGISAANQFAAQVVDILALANNAVSTTKIVNGAVTQAKVAVEAPSTYTPSFGGLIGAQNVRYGEYYKFGGMVIGWAGFNIGTGGNINDTISVELPMPARATNARYIVAARAFGSSRATGMGAIEGGSSLGINISTIGTAVWNATNPFNWDVGDEFTCIFAYAAAT